VGDAFDPDDQLRMDVRVRIVPVLTFGATANLFRQDEGLARVDVDERVGLCLNGTFTRDIEHGLEPAHVSFGSYLIPVGPLPVVPTPELPLVIGVDGEVRVHYSTGAAGDATMTFGARDHAGSGRSIIDQRRASVEALPGERSEALSDREDGAACCDVGRHGAPGRQSKVAITAPGDSS